MNNITNLTNRERRVTVDQGSRGDRPTGANPGPGSPGPVLDNQIAVDAGSMAIAAAASFLLGGLAWIAMIVGVLPMFDVSQRLVGQIAFAPPFAAAALSCYVAAGYRIQSRRRRAAAWWFAFGSLPGLLALQFLGVL